MPGDPLRRARIAYFRAEVHRGITAPPPVTAATLVEHQDTTYVVLRNDTTVLAVYKIRADGILQRMHRWPEALEEARRLLT